MTSETIIKLSNPHEVARLLNLIRDGIKILNKQDRTQRGIDGYTRSDLKTWEKELSKHTHVKCEFADSDL